MGVLGQIFGPQASVEDFVASNPLEHSMVEALLNEQQGVTEIRSLFYRLLLSNKLIFLASAGSCEKGMVSLARGVVKGAPCYFAFTSQAAFALGLLRLQRHAAYEEQDLVSLSLEADQILPAIANDQEFSYLVINTQLPVEWGCSSRELLSILAHFTPRRGRGRPF